MPGSSARRRPICTSRVRETLPTKQLGKCSRPLHFRAASAATLHYLLGRYLILFLCLTRSPGSTLSEEPCSAGEGGEAHHDNKPPRKTCTSTYHSCYKVVTRGESHCPLSKCECADWAPFQKTPSLVSGVYEKEKEKKEQPVLLRNFKPFCMCFSQTSVSN
jgi:hypothetical protein